MWMYNGVIRDMLIKMLDWYIRIENNFSVSAGKHGKYLKKYLPELVYKSFVKTYSGSDYDDFWAMSILAQARRIHAGSTHI